MDGGSPSGRRRPLPAARPDVPGDPSPDERVASYLRERYGARVGDVTVVPLFGDASTAATIGSWTPSGLRPVVEPGAVRAENLPFLVIRTLMAGWGLPVPKIVDADGSRGILLQEDLGDLTLQEC